MSPVIFCPAINSSRQSLGDLRSACPYVPSGFGRTDFSFRKRMKAWKPQALLCIGNYFKSSFFFLSEQPQTVIAIYCFLLYDKLKKYWFAWKVHIHQYHMVRVRLAGCCQRYRYWFNITAFVPRGPCNDWQARSHFNHTLRCSCLHLIANIWNITSSKLIPARISRFELLSRGVVGFGSTFSKVGVTTDDIWQLYSGTVEKMKCHTVSGSCVRRIRQVAEQF